MTLNTDQDDQIEICGYKKSTIKTTLTYTFIILTVGILRLIYHWVPHWFLKSTCVPCHVKQAQYILVTVSKILNKQNWCVFGCLATGVNASWVV